MSKLICSLCIFFFFSFSSPILFAQSASLIEAAYKAYYTDKDWNKSIELFTSLKTENETHADYAVRLASAFQNAGRYEESIKAFTDAVAIGPWPDIYYYQIAVCYARLNDEVNTIKHLQLAMDNGWPRYVNMENDKNFTPYNSSAAFQQLFGRTPKDSVSREKKWEADLNFLLSRMEILHYNMYNKVPRTFWDKEVKVLRDKIKVMKDNEIVVALMKIAALAGEGHTKVLPSDDGSLAFHAIPLTLYHFKNGCYVIRAPEEYKGLLGRKVVGIGSKKIGDLYKLSWQYAGHENTMHDRKMNPRFLVMAETLYDMNAITRLDEANIITENPDGTALTTVMKTQTLGQIKKDETSWLESYSSTNVPIYLKNKEEDWWYADLPEKRIFYLNVHYVVNQNGLPFSKFIDSVFVHFDESKAEKLVLDLRNCGGGNSALNRFLINAIIKRPSLNREQNFYTIIGRNTYSAGQNLVSDIEYRLNSTFIGEPTGSSPNFIGESNLLRLPYSQLPLIISNRYHQGGANNSLDKRPWISPSVLIELTSEDYAQNRDPIMNYILKN